MVTYCPDKQSIVNFYMTPGHFSTTATATTTKLKPWITNIVLTTFNLTANVKRGRGWGGEGKGTEKKKDKGFPPHLI